MNIYEITHQSENDPRISLSRDSFRLLAHYGIKRALILFASQNSPNYRLSLVTIDLKWEEGKRIKKEYSNPRRYSFFLGPETKTHTPETYLIKKDRVKDFDDLKERFSLEIVNKDFYTQIAILFTKLAGGKRTIGRTQFDEKGSLQLPSTSDDTIKKEFSVRLIGRLIFCWFLKKKVSVRGVSLIPEGFLSSNSIAQCLNFYHDVLEPLFFETLNKPLMQRKKEYLISPWSQIPFLNGGLFMPEYHDYYQVDPLGTSIYINTLKVPDSWLKELFEIFEIYNFTIDENTPVDIELSIEPEMLGRIFENLLAEINPETGNTARRSTGSYYTPRPIVEYMVDESLTQYLLSKTNLDENKISSLLAYEEEEAGLSEPEKDAVIDALDVIKIIDPACGSGAFPMGILQKMLLILQKIDPESKKWLSKKVPRIENSIVRKELQKKIEAGNWNYVHKLGIIQNSIYGVDIQSIAVDISKLRFFLSLIVDEKVDDLKENRGVESLPNLEFKFVCANSLIGLPNKNSQTELFEVADDIRELKRLREEYFRSYGDEKILIGNKFRSIQNKMFASSLEWLKCGGGDSQTAKLSQWNPFSNEPCEWFDPDWMFGVRDGFDIVIANPPYIGDKGHKDIFRPVRESYFGKQFYKGQMDLFYFFFHLALNIARINGSVVFITTNYYLTADGAIKLRIDFKNRSTIRKLLNFNELKIFESAMGQHNMITFLTKAKNDLFLAKTCITKKQGICKAEDLSDILNGGNSKTLYFNVRQKDLYDGNENYIRIEGCSEKKNNSIQIIVNKIKRDAELLGDICKINAGIGVTVSKITTKYINEYPELNLKNNAGVFVINTDEAKNLEKEVVKDFVKNSDIKQYIFKKNKDKLIYLTWKNNISNYPKVKKHLLKYKKILDDQGVRYEENFPWYALNRPRNKNIFEDRDKIILPYRAKVNNFAYSDTPIYGSRDVLFVRKKKKEYKTFYILALLNSKLFYYWLYHRGKRKGETLELYQKPLSEIPIKKISMPNQKPFIEIVDKILTITKSGGYLENPEKQAQVKEHKNQIDQLIYKLYDLTDDEIEIVENFNKKA